MEDYPRTLGELERRFTTEEACRAYLIQLRWPDGYRCPRCGQTKAWRVRQVLFQCAACGRQTSVTAGTIFQDTRTPLLTWFRAIWLVTSSKSGASHRGKLFFRLIQQAMAVEPVPYRQLVRGVRQQRRRHN